MIEDLAIIWLTETANLSQYPSLAKVKMSIVDYESLDREERIRLLVGQMQQDSRSNLKTGAGAFEALLAVINFSGPIDDDLRKDLWEMGNSRNVIVHRSSVVDRRFVEACPWVNVRVGEKLKIGNDDHHRFETAVLQYGTAVVNRVTAYRDQTTLAVSMSGRAADGQAILSEED